MARWAKTGVAFRAGDVLGDTKAVFKYTENPTHPRLLKHLETEPHALEGRFWRDGTMRVAGREYNGLIESKCYTHGEMTCLSCHSLHSYVAKKDQLAPKTMGDQSCLQCHAKIGSRIEEHTHHASSSSGSRCMNCHMPHTTFGLFVAMRSHRIDSPSAAVSAKTGRPNACNLCHLDRSLDWTAKTLTQWYGHGPVKLTDDQTKIASSVLLGTLGDGAQRAIIAWAMGWKPAQEASGIHWQAAFLGELLADPYSVTRQVAYRSIRTLPGFESFEFDYVAPRVQIESRVRAAIQTWRRVSAGRLDRHGPHLLLDPTGKFDVATHGRLLKARDNSPVSIIE